MASPGQTALAGTSPRPSALRQGTQDNRSKAFSVMTDQQNFEAPRPVSADPAVALAEMLGQLPARAPKPIVVKTSVEELAADHGLSLGDQNQLTIRRIKRGKGYSFVRANGTAIRHASTIRRLHRIAMSPAYREVRYSPDPNS